MSAIAAAVAAIVATGAAVVSWRALSANARSAKAAEDAAAIARQMLEMSREVRWTMAAIGTGDFMLTNIGGQTAFDVRADLDRTSQALGRWPQIGPGEARTFQASQTPGSPEAEVVVTYRLRPEKTGDGPRAWRHPLPPWPRR